MASYMKKAQEFVDSKNPFTDVLQQVQDKTGIKKLYQFLALCGVAVLWLVVGYGASLVCGIIGFAYPSYRSLKALESSDWKDDQQWLVYWVVYAAFILVEIFADIFLSWIPFYFLMKTGFLVWCMIPGESNGSMILYNKFIRPFFLKHEKKIDQLVDKGMSRAHELKDEASDIAHSVKDQATEYAVREGIKQMSEKKDE